MPDLEYLPPTLPVLLHVVTVLAGMAASGIALWYIDSRPALRDKSTVLALTVLVGALGIVTIALWLGPEDVQADTWVPLTLAIILGTASVFWWYGFGKPLAILSWPIVAALFYVVLSPIAFGLIDGFVPSIPLPLLQLITVLAFAASLALGVLARHGRSAARLPSKVG